MQPLLTQALALQYTYGWVYRLHLNVFLFSVHIFKKRQVYFQTLLFALKCVSLYACQQSYNNIFQKFSYY